MDPRGPYTKPAERNRHGRCPLYGSREGNAPLRRLSSRTRRTPRAAHIKRPLHPIPDALSEPWQSGCIVFPLAPGMRLAKPHVSLRLCRGACSRCRKVSSNAVVSAFRPRSLQDAARPTRTAVSHGGGPFACRRYRPGSGLEHRTRRGRAAERIRRTGTGYNR